MNKFLQICLLISLIGICESKKFYVTVNCQACKTNCGGVSSCYRVTGDNGYDEQYCGNFNCSLSSGYKTQIDSCTQDFNGTTCSTGICYFFNTSTTCVANLTETCRTQSYSTSVSCGSCTQQGCENCLIYTYNNSNTREQKCYSTSCSNFLNFTRSFIPCNNGIDSNGNYCICCQRSGSSAMNIKLPYCTTQSNLFNSSKFTAYAI